MRDGGGLRRRVLVGAREGRKAWEGEVRHGRSVEGGERMREPPRPCIPEALSSPMRFEYSSASNSPGTSPEASRAFIRSRKAGPKALDSSKI